MYSPEQGNSGSSEERLLKAILTSFLHLAAGYSIGGQPNKHAQAHFLSSSVQYQWWIQLTYSTFGAGVRDSEGAKSIFIPVCYLRGSRDVTLRWASDLMEVWFKPHSWYSRRHNWVGVWFRTCSLKKKRISAAAKCIQAGIWTYNAPFGWSIGKTRFPIRLSSYWGELKCCWRAARVVVAVWKDNSYSRQQ